MSTIEYVTKIVDRARKLEDEAIDLAETTTAFQPGSEEKSLLVLAKLEASKVLRARANRQIPGLS